MKQKRAVSLLRDGLHYRKIAFDHGLQMAGFTIKNFAFSDPEPGDVIVTWNRSFRGGEDAKRFEACGATVVVAENGLLGKNFNGGNYFSLALDHVAGAGGTWPVGGPDRWDDLRVELRPWRSGGNETIILAQRGIGEPGIKSPDGWAERIQAELGGRIRKHPGRDAPETPIEDDLRNAKQVITWASAAAFQALLLGVPVFYQHPAWAGAGAALPLSEFGKREPLRDDGARLALFRRIAWAQWTIDEIDSGTPFKHLLGEYE